MLLHANICDKISNILIKNNNKKNYISMSTAVRRGGKKISHVGSTANSSSTLGKMADVSKDKLRKEITAILKNADLKQMSAKKVRQQLEEKLEVDLTDQKKMVDDLVMEFLKEKKPAKKGKKTDTDDEEDEDKDGEEENGAGDDDEEDEEEEKDKRKATKRSAPRNNKASDSEEPSEDDDEEEEYGPKKKAKTSAKKAGGKKKKKGSDNDSDEDWGKNKKKSGGAKKGGGGGGKGGYTKPCHLSPELAKLVGKDTMPRHEVVKKIWAIIKERNLYDPRNKQFAICDSDLKKVFGVERFRTFGMMKYLKSHFVS